MKLKDKEVPGSGFILAITSSSPVFDEVWECPCEDVDYKNFFPDRYINWEGYNGNRIFNKYDIFSTDEYT